MTEEPKPEEIMSDIQKECLSPCPFCGITPRWTARDGGLVLHPPHSWCFLSDKAFHLDRWNARSTPPALVEIEWPEKKRGGEMCFCESNDSGVYECDNCRIKEDNALIDKCIAAWERARKGKTHDER